MAVADDVGVYWNLFEGQFPDAWKDDDDFASYLSELGAYSVERLQLEPEHIREERRCVLNSTQKLAFNNYKAFIETAQCTRDVFQDFVSVEKHVAELLDKLPCVVSACKGFMKESQDINTKRRLNSLALGRHTQLLEVLEVPQVMETCVRNAYYEEALELHAHVCRMEKKHRGIPIIRMIWEDVQLSMDLMLSQLLQQLKGAIQLPACLKVVGLLKRMNVFSDQQLRLKFLQARDSWLQGILNAIPSDNAYQHINKVIELSRVHLFDVITQYRAIFPDDDASLSPYSAASSREKTGPVEGALFYCWVNEKIWQFLHTLEEDLWKGGMGIRLDSLLGQCMYYGLSFSRIGADFRCLIVPVFTRFVMSSFQHAIRTAKHNFHDSMKHLTLLNPLRGPSSSLTHPPSSSPSPSSPSSSSSSSSLPHSLLDFPPLASLANTLIAVFNGLRQCAPLALGPEVCQELRRLLESVVHDVGEYHRMECKNFTEKEKTAFEQMCRVVLNDFLPFVRKLFTTIFSQSAVEELVRSTPYALQCIRKNAARRQRDQSDSSLDLRMELDVRAIGEPLRKVVPALFESEPEALEVLPVLPNSSPIVVDTAPPDHSRGATITSSPMSPSPLLFSTKLPPSVDIALTPPPPPPPPPSSSSPQVQLTLLPPATDGDPAPVHVAMDMELPPAVAIAAASSQTQAGVPSSAGEREVLLQSTHMQAGASDGKERFRDE